MKYLRSLVVLAMAIIFLVGGMVNDGSAATPWTIENSLGKIQVNGGLQNINYTLNNSTYNGSSPMPDDFYYFTLSEFIIDPENPEGGKEIRINGFGKTIQNRLGFNVEIWTDDTQVPVLVDMFAIVDNNNDGILFYLDTVTGKITIDLEDTYFGKDYFSVNSGARGDLSALDFEIDRIYLELDSFDISLPSIELSYPSDGERVEPTLVEIGIVSNRAAEGGDSYIIELTDEDNNTTVFDIVLDEQPLIITKYVVRGETYSFLAKKFEYGELVYTTPSREFTVGDCSTGGECSFDSVCYVSDGDSGGACTIDEPISFWTYMRLAGGGWWAIPINASKAVGYVITEYWAEKGIAVIYDEDYATCPEDGQPRQILLFYRPLGSTEAWKAISGTQYPEYEPMLTRFILPYTDMPNGQYEMKAQGIDCAGSVLGFPHIMGNVSESIKAYFTLDVY